MLRVLLLLAVGYCGLVEAGGGVLIQKIKPIIPPGCLECMQQCPHEDRVLKECDRGCTESCSESQASAYKKQTADKTKI